jgi:hypothetical protein
MKKYIIGAMGILLFIDIFHLIFPLVSLEIVFWCSFLLLVSLQKIFEFIERKL